jgi:hypothetical protein
VTYWWYLVYDYQAGQSSNPAMLFRENIEDYLVDLLVDGEERIKSNATMIMISSLSDAPAVARNRKSEKLMIRLYRLLRDKKYPAVVECRVE